MTEAVSTEAASRLPSIESLPSSLIAHIFSYTITSTADIASLRLVNRFIGHTIIPLLPSASPRGQYIKCASDSSAEKIAGAFVSDLTGVDYDDFEQYGVMTGDTITLSDDPGGPIHIFGKATTKIRSVLFIGEPQPLSQRKSACSDGEVGRGDSNSDETPVKKKSKSSHDDSPTSSATTAKDRERLVVIRNLCEKLLATKVPSELNSLFQQVDSQGLLESLDDKEYDSTNARDGDQESQDEADESSDDDEDEDYTYLFPALVTLTVPRNADYIAEIIRSDTETTDGAVQEQEVPTALRLRGSKQKNPAGAQNVTFHLHENDRGRLYDAPIFSSSAEAYTVRVLIFLQGNCENINESMYMELWEVKRMAFTNVWNQHQSQGVKEGVAIVDGAVGREARELLRRRIDALVADQELRGGGEDEGGVDYHPHSSQVVRDLVHPALYSYVKNLTELKARVADVAPCKFQNSPMAADDEEKSVGVEVGSDDDSNIQIEDYWGRKYEDSLYQWLPTYFHVDSDGRCTIEDYINNLVPRENDLNRDLYQSLTNLFEQVLPYLESVYSYVRAVRPRLRSKDEIVEWGNAVPAAIDAPYCSLRGHKLQVITKIVDYELKPGQTHTGVWHVEGMSHEEIVATALYILDRDEDIQGGDILFKRAFHRDEANYIFSTVAQTRPDALDSIVEEGLVPLGSVETTSGRLIVFPNSHVHKVRRMKNVQSARAEDEGGKSFSATHSNDEPPYVARRRIVVFFLVNPERRIISTREVPPQQARAGGRMNHDDALQHRLKLMKERKFTKQDWNVRTIELCEH